MSCIHPILAVDYGINPDTGKHIIKILPKRPDLSYTKALSMYGVNLLQLPCGKCIQCRATKANEWAVRCYLESLYYLDNCFLTLTYDDSHCPTYLVKKDVQIFLKRLRNEGFKFRYFACGEYGSRTKRPHYHLLIFGYMPSDLVSLGNTSSGNPLFTSDFLSKLWNKGFVSVGTLEPSSICYTARYNAKKLNFGIVDKDKKEFLLMSRMPGLGFRYIAEHLDEICSNEGSLYLGEFGIKSSSRYILNLIQKHEPFTFELIKQDKMQQAKKMLFDNLYHSGCSNLNTYQAKNLKQGLDAEAKVVRGF